MRYAGVLFDLFGTLIPPFRMREHMEVLRECAQRLGLSFEACYRCWGETYLQRTRGEFVSVADNFRWVARQTGEHLTPQGLTHAEAAAVVGVSEKTVQRRLNRARLLLAERLADLRT